MKSDLFNTLIMK